MHLLILLSLLADPGAADDSHCALEGKAVLEAEGKPVKGTVVAYIENVPPELRAHAKETFRVVQHDRQFSPRVLVVVKGDQVEFRNQDNEKHGVFSNSAANAFEDPYSLKDVTAVHTFSRVGPVTVQCDIHERMRADVLVVPSKLHATADDQGQWRIGGLPRGGTYKVVFWEPNGGTYSQDVPCTQAEVRVGEVRLTRAPAVKLMRRNGEAYHPAWNN